MRTVTLLLALAAFSLSESKPSKPSIHRVRLGMNPGAIIKIRRSALNSFFGTISRLTPRYARKVPIPELSATISGVEIKTTDLRVSDFAEPKINYSLAPPNKINGSLELPSVVIQGPFNASRRTFFKTQYDSGQLIFRAENVKVSFQATIGEFDSGVPMIDSFECQSHLGPAQLNVKNAREKFAIEVMSMGARSIRPLYHSQVCSTAKTLVSSQLNHLLGRMPNTLAVNRNLAVKYRLSPKVANDYVQVALYGKVLSEDMSPFEPAKFVEAPNDDAMVVMLLSDAPFNDLAYQAFVNQKLEFTVNNESSLFDYIRLKCDPKNDLCLGNIAPELVKKYGSDALVEAEFKALEAPEIEFVQGKATFKASFSASLTITPANDTTKPYHETTAKVDLKGALKVRIQSNILYSKIDTEQIAVHIDEDNKKQWENRVQNTVKTVIQEYVNSNVLQKGIPLKLPFGVGVDEPLISFAPHTLQVHSGFEFLAQTSSEEADGKKD